MIANLKVLCFGQVENACFSGISTSKIPIKYLLPYFSLFSMFLTLTLTLALTLALALKFELYQRISWIMIKSKNSLYCITAYPFGLNSVSSKHPFFSAFFNRRKFDIVAPPVTCSVKDENSDYSCLFEFIRGSWAYISGVVIRHIAYNFFKLFVSIRVHSWF